MKNLLFYISGHGYGHATRSIEVIKKLIIHENYHCFIKTSAPEWLFRANLDANYTYSFLVNDIGTLQDDWLHVDKKSSLAAFQKLWANRHNMIENELNFIKTYQINLIFGDIPPLAFEIAAAAGLPAIAMSNFSWDWIYQPYLTDFSGFNSLIESIRCAYHKADLLLRLPFYGEMTAFKKIVDIPLVARLAQFSKEHVRQILQKHGFRNKPLILIALRKEDLKRIDRNRLKRLNAFTFLTFDDCYAIDENFFQIPQDLIPFQEIVHAADIVISKLGYGIVSECIANQAPLLFTERFDFQEYEVLKKGILEQGLGQYVPLMDFLAGNWESYIQKILDRPPRGEIMQSNGAAVAVKKIREYL